MNQPDSRILAGLTLLLLTLQGFAVAIAGPTDSVAAARRVSKSNRDLTFRPTVIIRKGNSQGSGTVIVSKAGESLILTASHVVKAKEAGPILVEVHRYNMGVETKLPEEGWPLSLPAEVVAADPVGDVALLKITGRPAFPFVARLALEGEEPKKGATVVSLGIDGGESLSSWPTRLQETASFAMDSSHEGDPELLVTQADRRFFLTAKPPAHGRSGGGLYSSSGSLVGVCVGRIAMEKQKRPQGLFASIESVRKLLRENDLEGAVAKADAKAKRRPVTPTQSAGSPP